MAGIGGSGDRAALERLLGGPEMAWLVQRVRDRLPTVDDELLAGVVVLTRPTVAQRDAAVRLVGPRPRAGATVRLDLAQVEEILRRGPWPAGLADAVVTLAGPVVDRAAARRDDAAAWARANAGLSVGSGRFPGLADWWDAWCAAGGLRRTVRSEATRVGEPPGPQLAQRLVGELVRVLDALPGGGTPLAVFARQVVGDAHGLDETRPLGRLAGAVVAAAFAGDGGPEPSRRDAWARAGVVMSNVSSTVLSLGVGGSVTSASSPLGAATATVLEAMRSARSAVLLTLDQVRSDGVASLPSGAVIHVCENPTVVEVVARSWFSRLAGQEVPPSPVLVCTSGQPSTAVVELLQVLAADGAKCRYHGDFDWAGLRIANALRTRVPWTPWRFTAADYRAAASVDRPSSMLVGDPVDASWDPELTRAMAHMGRAVEEEAVVDLLTADLLRGR